MVHGPKLHVTMVFSFPSIIEFNTCKGARSGCYTIPPLGETKVASVSGVFSLYLCGHLVPECLVCGSGPRPK